MAGPELRRDPLNGRWVLVAPGRMKRPGCFPARMGEAAETPEEARACPFCSGRESQTPPEIEAVRGPGGRPDGPGWRVRVVPNKYPALAAAAGGAGEEGMISDDRRPAIGPHEVVIDSPWHDREIDEIAPEEAALTWRIIRGRVRALEAKERPGYIQVFKNRGREAGASLRHPHTQIIGLPLIPPRVAEESSRFAAWTAERGGCLLCRLLEEVISRGDRLIEVNRSFAAWAPFASAFPYETRIAPRRHGASFAGLEDGEIMDLAGIVRAVLTALRRGLDDPPYNIVLVQAPPGRPGFHWHLDVLPALIRTAGFEWGTGVHINPVAPEEAAIRLRRAASSEAS